jgi:alpha-tubulin suppressor-like RCC1 family protein
VYMWGNGFYGVLGDNNVNRHLVTIPTLIDPVGFNGARIVQISCGARHNGAITSDGQVYMWGLSEDGELGDNIGNHVVPIPTLIDPFRFNGARIVQISCGGAHTGAITSDGQVYMWGFGGVSGRLGDNNADEDHNVAIPTLIDPARFNGARIVQISCGNSYTGALTSEGQVYMWGDGGALGSGDNDDAIVPTLIDQNRFNGACIVQISCGIFHSGAVTSDGKLYMWGDGDFGRLGDGNTRRHIEQYPILIDRFNGARVVEISCGANHTGAITSDGDVYMWGNGHYGVLGDDDITQHSVGIPMYINSFHDARIVHISCGADSHTAAIAGIPFDGIQPLKIASTVCVDCSAVTSTKCSECNILYCESCFTRAH